MRVVIQLLSIVFCFMFVCLFRCPTQLWIQLHHPSPPNPSKNIIRSVNRETHLLIKSKSKLPILRRTHQMISYPNLIFYACIAKGPTILAEFSSKEAGIESLAQKCIEKSPPFHSMFSHTVSNRTYNFLIDDPFVYFLIFHEDLEKSESFWVLNRLKSALEDFLLTGIIVGTDNLTQNCLQSHFNPIFSEIMALELELVSSPKEESPNPSLESNKGKRTVVTPLLGKPIKGLKKKKRLGGLEVNGGEAKHASGGFRVENTVDVSEDFKDFPVSVQKSGAAGFYVGVGDRQKAKQTWRKHVWVVLILDLLVCATLFGIWLWVCRGFQCIDD